MSGMVEKLYLAKPRGFCAGVVMAIETVEKFARELRESDHGTAVRTHDCSHSGG